MITHVSLVVRVISVLEEQSKKHIKIQGNTSSVDVYS